MENTIFYPSLDPVLTGRRINEAIIKSGYSVRELQMKLNLSCPQPIYRWMHGKNFPTIDHLYIMSRIFDTHMEELIVACNENESDENEPMDSSRNPDT